MVGVGVADAGPLIGRAREVEVLEQSLATAQAGTARAVLLAGEAGIGKSRLAAEACRWAAGAGFTMARGVCYEQDAAFPYAPWIEALRPVLPQGNALEVGWLGAAAAQELATLWPELAAGPAAWPGGQAPEPEAEKRRLFEAVVQFMLRLAERAPLLLVLEDLHWSDESSLDLLRYLARRLGGQRIALLATYRSDDLSAPLRQLLAEFSRVPWIRELALRPLSRDETEALVRTRLGAQRGASPGTPQPIRADFMDFVAALTDGNPFFIEEVLSALVEAGGSAAAPWLPPWSADRRVQVPRSVQEAVWQRTERLSPGARRLLQLAAVVGRRVDFGLIEALMGAGEAELLGYVRELTAAQLLVEASADELVFRHALTREAVYTTLLARERRGLHRQVLAAMAERYASSLPAHTADLAYHAYGAEDWARAMTYASRAGDQARALDAMPESAVHYSRALDAAGRLGVDPPLELLSARAQVYENLGQFDGARADYERTVELARAGGQEAAEWQALLDLGFLWTARDYGVSGDYLQAALALAYRLESPAAVAHSLNRLGNWHFNQMRLAAALASYRQALDLFRELGDRLGVAETLDLLGTATFIQGDLIAGRSYVGEAIGLLRDLGQKRRLAQCLLMLPLAYRFNTEILGEFDPAELLAAADEGLALARAMGWRAGELQAYARQTQYAREAGDYGQALAAVHSALAIAEEIGHTGFLAAGEWGTGELYLDLFDLAQAEPHLQRACALARASGSAIWQHHANLALARLCVLRRRWVEAEAALGARPASLPDAGLPTQPRENWAAWADLLLARGDAAGALAVVDRLIAGTLHYQEYGPHAVPRLALLRGQALHALGRDAAAEEELRAAAEVARAQGKRALLWRIAAAQGHAAQALGRRREAQAAFGDALALVQELAGGISDAQLRQSFGQGAAAGLPRLRPPTPRRAAREQFGGLSAREREVAALITTGRSNRQIAETLVIAERTVDRHVANIMAKLGYNSRAQIAAWAAERGLRAGLPTD